MLSCTDCILVTLVQVTRFASAASCDALSWIFSDSTNTYLQNTPTTAKNVIRLTYLCFLHVKKDTWNTREKRKWNEERIQNHLIENDLTSAFLTCGFLVNWLECWQPQTNFYSYRLFVKESLAVVWTVIQMEHCVWPERIHSHWSSVSL